MEWQSLVGLAFYIAFSLAVIMIIVGLSGMFTSLIKHAPRNRWVSLLKKGLLTLSVTLIFFILIAIVLKSQNSCDPKAFCL